MLTAPDIEAAFMDLGTLAADEGRVIDMAVYGGSALMLVTNFRAMSDDVDAIANDHDQADLERLALEVAARRGWSKTWLNDDVFPYLSDTIESFDVDHALLRTYPSDARPGLRVFVPSAEYMCALKLMAMRVDAASGAKDLHDLVHLTAILGLDSPAKAVVLASRFYGRGEVARRVESRIHELYRLMEAARGTTGVSAPAYLGRGGPAA
jgi:Nucleotidyl transferase AbiEii toxin, Type IV TA system